VSSDFPLMTLWMSSFKCQISPHSVLEPLIYQCHMPRPIREYSAFLLTSPRQMFLFLKERVGHFRILCINKEACFIQMRSLCNQQCFLRTGSWMMNFYTIHHCCLYIYIMGEGGALKCKWKELGKRHKPCLLGSLTPGISTWP
jgi:hypothetical protein